ncbi:MAG: YqaA family protein [Haloarculaceae archaeon]
MVCTATGPTALLAVGVYSFLIAVVLPLPGEIVLAPVGSLHLGLSQSVTLTVIILVSAVGKMAGSLVAFHVGQEAKQSGVVIDALRRSRFDVIEWSERRTVGLARSFGYVGLAAALSVPGFPDTLSIYAFSVLETDYVKFAAATFVGSVARLLVTLGIAGAAITLL